MYKDTGSEKASLERAHARVNEIKGFYKHLTVYLVINTLLLLLKVIGNSYYGESFMAPVWHFSTFSTWFLWGLGLFLHGVKVFSTNTAFFRKWEERQIHKYMEEEKGAAEKLMKDM